MDDCSYWSQAVHQAGEGCSSEELVAERGGDVANISQDDEMTMHLQDSASSSVQYNVVTSLRSALSACRIVTSFHLTSSFKLIPLGRRAAKRHLN